MIGFEFKYLTLSDIINNMKLLSEYSINEYSILIGLTIIIILSIYYFFPLFYIYSENSLKKKEKLKKKELIKQIIMQKDINDEIEKELNIN